MENPFKEQQKGCILCNITVDYRNTQVCEDLGFCVASSSSVETIKHKAAATKLVDAVIPIMPSYRAFISWDFNMQACLNDEESRIDVFPFLKHSETTMTRLLVKCTG